MTERRHRPALAVLFVLVAFGLFSCVNVLVKVLGTTYSVVEILFFRNLFAIVPSATLVLATASPEAFKTRRLGCHVWRTVFGQLSLLTLFTAFQFMSLADVVAISHSAPLFVTVLSMPLLAERVGAHRWAAVCVGFIGVLVIVRPGADVASVGSLFALGNAITYALSVIVMRQLGATEAPSTVAFYYAILSVPAMALALPFVWVTPTLAHFALMALGGLLGGTGQFFTALAYRHGEASLVSPFVYSTLIWSIIFDLIFFATLPSAALIVGAAILIASGIYILRRELRHGARPAPAGEGEERK